MMSFIKMYPTQILILLFCFFIGYMGTAQIPESIGASNNDIGKSYTAGTRHISGLPKYFPDTTKNETLFAFDKNNNRNFTWNPKSSRWEVDKIRGNSSSTPRMETINSLVFDYTNTILQDSNNLKYYRWDLTSNVWASGLNTIDTTGYKIATNTYVNGQGFKEIYTGASLPSTSTGYNVGNKFLLTTDSTEATYQGSNKWLVNVVKGNTTPIANVTVGSQIYDYTRATYKNSNLSILSGQTTDCTLQNGLWKPLKGYYSIEDFGGNLGANGFFEPIAKAISLGITQVIFDANTSYYTNGDVVIPSTMSIVVKSGCILDMRFGSLLTVNGKFIDESNSQIFIGNGNAKFGLKSVEYIKPEWWGCIGDGNYDNLSSFNKCVISDSLSHHEIYFKNGTYRFTAGQRLFSNTTIRGENEYSTLFFLDSDIGTMFYANGNYNGGYSGNSIKNFSITCNRTTRSGGSAITFIKVGDFNIENVKISSMWDGIILNNCATGTIKNVKIDNSNTAGNANNGISVIGNCISTHLSNCFVSTSGVAYYVGDGTDTYTMYNCTAQYTATAQQKQGLLIENSTGVSHDPRYIKVTNCFFESIPTYNCIEITKGYNIDIQNTYTSWGLRGIFIQGITAKADIKDVKIVGGSIFLAQREGILVNRATAVNISGVSISDNSISATNTYSGISASNCDLNAIGNFIGNQLWNGDNPNTGTVENFLQKYGVEITGNVNYLIENQYINLPTSVNITGSGNLGLQINPNGNSTNAGLTVQSGNAGIGTTNPSYKLDIDANTNSSGNPIRLTGLQPGAATDSIASVNAGVVRRLTAAQVVQAGITKTSVTSTFTVPATGEYSIPFTLTGTTNTSVVSASYIATDNTGVSFSIPFIAGDGTGFVKVTNRTVTAVTFTNLKLNLAVVSY